MLPPRNYNMYLDSKCANSNVKIYRNQVFDLSMKRRQILMKPVINRNDFHDMQEISAKIDKLNRKIHSLEIEDSVCESDFDIFHDSKEYDV